MLNSINANTTVGFIFLDNSFYINLQHLNYYNQINKHFNIDYQKLMISNPYQLPAVLKGNTNCKINILYLNKLLNGSLNNVIDINNFASKCDVIFIEELYYSYITTIDTILNNNNKAKVYIIDEAAFNDITTQLDINRTDYRNIETNTIILTKYNYQYYLNGDYPVNTFTYIYDNPTDYLILNNFKETRNIKKFNIIFSSILDYKEFDFNNYRNLINTLIFVTPVLDMETYKIYINKVEFKIMNDNFKLFNNFNFNKTLVSVMGSPSNMTLSTSKILYNNRIGFRNYIYSRYEYTSKQNDFERTLSQFTLANVTKEINEKELEITPFKFN